MISQRFAQTLYANPQFYFNALVRKRYLFAYMKKKKKKLQRAIFSSTKNIDRKLAVFQKIIAQMIREFHVFSISRTEGRTVNKGQILLLSSKDTSDRR